MYWGWNWGGVWVGDWWGRIVVGNGGKFGRELVVGVVIV